MTEPRPLVVDLDGTLIRSDMLVECWWQAMSSRPGAALAAIWTLVRRGRAAFKAELAGLDPPDPAGLPYNEDVLSLIETRRAGGDPVMLASASDQRMVDAVAAHLGCFDAAHGSDGGTNLKAGAKAEFLVARHGAAGFDYAGDSRADLAVWSRACRAITVDAPEPLRRAAAAAAPGEPALHLGRPQPLAAIWLRAMRPHQWAKNLLVFLPLVAAHGLDGSAWVAALVAFAAFSVVASGVYLINDLLDLAADRAHPRKRFRPLASGAMKLAHASVLAPMLLALGLMSAAVLVNGFFLAVLSGYLALTFAYSLTLKRRLVIDICTLAGLYTTRVFAGGAAAGIAISPWLLGFSIFLFFSLAAVKRQAELVNEVTENRAGTSGRAYLTDDLPIVSTMAISAGFVAVLVLALYLNAPAVRGLYATPELMWGICPVLLYWISRAVMLAHRGWMHDDPVIFAIKDPKSQICAVIVIILVAAATLI